MNNRTLSMTLVVAGLLSPALASADKVNVCHVPPGNPENAHVINISTDALPAHLDHGDYVVGEGDECVGPAGGGAPGAATGDPAAVEICAKKGQRIDKGRRVDVTTTGSVTQGNLECPQ